MEALFDWTTMAAISTNEGHSKMTSERMVMMGENVEIKSLRVD